MDQLGGKEYSKYKYSLREFCCYGGIFYVLSGFVLYLFYHHIWFSMVAALFISMVFLHIYKKSLIHKKRILLQNQFKDLLDVLVSGIGAGYSIENALISSKKELRNIYAGSDLVIQELEFICNRLKLGVGIDILFENLGVRSGVEEILVFARVYKTARKSGGNLISVMKRTGQNISEKIEIKNEIETMIAGKKLEARCMMVVPLFILAYMQVCSPDFLAPLYYGYMGRGIMTIVFMVYVLCLYWIQKIIDIEF